MRKTISLSTYIDVERSVLENQGVLDVSLGLDTPYFIDPRLLFSKKSDGVFSHSSKKVLDYFSLLIKVIKNSADSPQLQSKAISMIATKEPKGLSIGYGSKRDSGTSTSEAVAKKVISTFSELLHVGIEDPELMELMILFVDGYGPDSISDLIAHIIYDDLCIFTQEIAKKLNVKTSQFTINGTAYQLPVHPYKLHQIVFVPMQYISVLLVANDWDSVQSSAAYNEKLRKELDQIIFPILKKEIFSIRELDEKQKEVFRRQFKRLLSVYKQIIPEGYDTVLDSRGYYNLQYLVEKYNKDYSAKQKLFQADQIKDAVRDIILSYKRNIEEIGWNKQLYQRTKTNQILKNKPHHEDVAQLLFVGLADVHCSYTNIMLARESKMSSGPVDFSLGTGYGSKVLVEIKKSTNRLVHGYEEQLVKYARGEKAIHTFYVVIVIKEQLQTKEKPVTDLEILKNRYEENLKKGITSPEVIIIDGLIYNSPSKI